MSNKLCKRAISSKRQESTIKEVTQGLGDLVTQVAYNPWPGDFEIVAIYPPEDDKAVPKEEVMIKTPARRPKAKVISYQGWKKRLLRLSA